MSLKSKINTVRNDPLIICKKLCRTKPAEMIPDRTMLKIQYRLYNHKKLNLKQPEGYNEKIQWLKLYDRRPIYNTMVDKVSAKDYVSRLIGPEYIIKTLGVWKHFDEIDFEELPEQFVLKCNHDSGSVVLCRDKASLDRRAAKAVLEAGLRENMFWRGREWAYKDVEPRILAEEMLFDNGDALTDYKFFCFDGVPKICYLSKDRSSDARTDFFDMDFHPLPLRMKDPPSDVLPECPDFFEEMKDLSAKLSQGFPHVRVDFYHVNGQIYFGELTLYSNSGFIPINPPEWDLKLGSMLHIPQENE